MARRSRATLKLVLYFVASPLVTLGWERKTRVHGCLIHLDIIDGKVWVQLDETEDGVTRELFTAGIPPNEIVLGFHPADVRSHTGYAIV